MRECHEYIDLLTAQLDGQISEAEERELFEHLLACPECRIIQEDLLELSDTMSEMQVTPPADLTTRIMDAVAAEKKAKIIPFYKRRHFLSSAITAAAMFAIIAVTGSNLNNLLGESNAPAPAQAPSVAANVTPAAAAPAGEQAGGTESEGYTANDTNAPQSYAGLVNPEDIEPVDPIDLLKGLGIIEGDGGQTVVTSGGGQNSAPAPVSTPAPAAAEPSTPPAETPAAMVEPIIFINPIDAPVVTEHPPEVTPNPVEPSPVPEEPLSVGELTFYLTELPLPAFLAESGVPDPEKGLGSYRLELTVVEYQILELQFVANGLEYSVITEGSGFSPSGTVGAVNIIYAIPEPEPTEGPDVSPIVEPEVS